jgi:hypothetical protein
MKVDEVRPTYKIGRKTEEMSELSRVVSSETATIDHIKFQSPRNEDSASEGGEASRCRCPNNEP